MIRPSLLALLVICGTGTEGGAQGATDGSGPPRTISSRDGRISVSVPPAPRMLDEAGVRGMGGETLAGWRYPSDEGTTRPGALALVVGYPFVGDHLTGVALFQVGTSADPEAVRHCTTEGLNGGNGAPVPNRRIDGITFVGATNGDDGAGHHIAMTDYRAVVDGLCVAVDVGMSSVNRVEPPSPHDLSQDAAKSLVDQLLDNVRFVSAR